MESEKHLKIRTALRIITGDYYTKEIAELCEVMGIEFNVDTQMLPVNDKEKLLTDNAISFVTAMLMRIE